MSWWQIISKYILPGPDIFVKNEMLTSMRGIDKIKEFEGFRAKPYLCSAGKPTIGYGSTYYANGEKVKLGDSPITQADALGLLKNTLRIYEDAVNNYVTRPLTQQQFDALVSFTYNFGPEKFRGSTLLKKVNNNPDDPAIHAEFMKWKYSRGKVEPGLISRRKAESQIYFNGVY